MLVLSGQAKTRDLKGNSGVRQMGVQEVDIVGIVTPITKYAVTVMEPADICSTWAKRFIWRVPAVPDRYGSTCRWTCRVRRSTRASLRAFDPAEGECPA
jgi:hypothetical protein